jgi:hypothetical protein
VIKILSKRSSRKQICRLERGKTTDHDSYVDETLKHLIDQLEENKPKFGCQGLVFYSYNIIPLSINAYTTFLNQDRL